MSPTETEAKRLIDDAWESKVKPLLRVTENDCWEFTGRVVGTGYGQVWMDKHRSTHRVAAAKFLGLDLNDATTLVCHRCDNPPCCNPDHLFLGTASDNVRDAIAKGRRSALPPNALPKETCAKGHDLSVTRKKKSKNGGADCAVCRRERRSTYDQNYRRRQKERSS